MPRTTHQTPPVAHVGARRLLALLLCVAGAAALAACSTTEGFGKDVKNLGGDIEETAAENK